MRQDLTNSFAPLIGLIMSRCAKFIDIPSGAVRKCKCVRRLWRLFDKSYDPTTKWYPFAWVWAILNIMKIVFKILIKSQNRVKIIKNRKIIIIFLHQFVENFWQTWNHSIQDVFPVIPANTWPMRLSVPQKSIKIYN